MTREIVVTRANGYDATRIAKLLRHWVGAARIPWPEPEPIHLVGWVLNTINEGYVVIAEQDGRLHGTAAIEPFHLPWAPSQFLMKDTFFYVPQESRKLGVAEHLITALKLYCAEREVPLVMSIISGLKTERVERWYGIKGGRYAGGTFVFGLEG